MPPPLAKAANKPGAFGTEHELLGLSRRIGWPAARFEEGCHTAPTVAPAEGPPLPNYVFPAPSASIQELLDSAAAAKTLVLTAPPGQVGDPLTVWHYVGGQAIDDIIGDRFCCQ